MTVMEKYLTVKEVARLLDYSIETVKRKLRAGELPGFKVGREWRVNPTVLKQHLENQGQQKNIDN